MTQDNVPVIASKPENTGDLKKRLWWLPWSGELPLSAEDTRRMFDRVHTALQGRLDEEKIECSFPTQTLNRQMNPQNAERLSQAL